jgi:hypothetical protein
MPLAAKGTAGSAKTYVETYDALLKDAGAVPASRAVQPVVST